MPKNQVGLEKSLSKGFTLIECLVALFIIAIVLASSTKAIGSAIEDVRDSYVREAANWIASNQFQSYSIENNYPQLGSSQQSITMAGIDFLENIVVTSTANPYFRKVMIEVSEKKTPKYIVFKTVNFIAQY